MELPKHINEMLTRLYSNQYLGDEEIRNLDQWLKQVHSDPHANNWLQTNWEQSENIDRDIPFEEVRRRIAKYRQEKKVKSIRYWSGLLQKTAAILVLPLLAVSIWMVLNRQPNASPMMLATAKGERTHVFLPDGSEVWLNVDSKLKYATTYNATNRELILEGEALFKVAKGKKHPFIVTAHDMKVRAVGTEFNITAYETDPHASTFLKEGIVELSYKPKGEKELNYPMKPGEKAILNRNLKSIEIRKVVSENDIHWINGELYFENEPMDQVFRKTERWYDIKISYQLNDFTNETLTVNLKNSESIDRLMEIIDEAMGIHVKQNGNEYVITRNRKTNKR